MKTSTRSRWKAFSVLAAVLVMGVAGLCHWASKPAERKEFVSKVDPVYGDRCRFTVSTDWQWDPEPDEHTSLSRDFETRTFTLLRNPLRNWINTIILHRSPPAPQTITLIHGSLSSLNTTIDGESYPIPIIYPPEKIEKRRHFKIDGCAATIATLRSGVEYRTLLYVFASNDSIILHGSYEKKGTEQTAREMKAIIASFHVGKVGQQAVSQGSSRP